MSPRTSYIRILALVGIVAAGACTRDLDTLGPAQFPSVAGVFGEGFTAGVRFESFGGGAKLDALSEDGTIYHSGSVGLHITVPAPGDPTGGYAGGAFIANTPRDLTGYNALTFWARASISANLDVAGIGNDNTGTSQYTAQTNGLPLTTAWKKYTIPIPLASKLTKEGGLFYFAEGPENGAGYDIWLDDIQFESVNTITNPRPVVAPAAFTYEVGATLKVSGTTVTFAVEGTDQTLVAAPAYFTFVSSDQAVATVAPDGTITLVGPGTSTISALLGTTAATGTVTLLSAAPPATAAAVPTDSAVNVISLFSNSYTNRVVDTWSAVWDQADVADIQIAGNDVKKYTNLAFAGIEFTSAPVDASAMTSLHLDVYALDATQFKVKLVDFGGNGVFGGGDDSEYELTLSTTTTPALTAGTWSSLNIPLSAFSGLTGKGHLAQMIISGSSRIVYLDNVYFFKASTPPPPTSPTVAAPTPNKLAANVISLYSNAYTNVTVDTWSAVWDAADVADTVIAGNATKKYTNVVFAGIEFTSAPVNASAMTGFHMDIWTPDQTSAGATFKVKLVDFGADGAFGGGDDVEQELTFTNASTPPLATGSWVGIDVPLSAFTGLVTKAHLAQMVISGTLSTFYVDNVYLYTSGAAPTLSSVAITPKPVSLIPTGTQQLTVTGTYSDASTANLTAGSTFNSSATGVATVSGSGLVTAVAVGTATITATHTASGLSDSVVVTVATGSTGGLVFFGGFDPGVSFVDFGGATNAVSIDAGTTNNGRSSFKAIITGSGGYSGGAFAASLPRDLSSFNALTFWAKGSAATSTLKVGIGNNGTNNLLNAEAIGIPLTTTFQKFIIPLPDPSKFVNYDGLFHFADGPNNYTVWFNDVQYENLPVGQVGPPTAALAAWPSLTVAVGTPAQMNPAPNTVNWTVPALPNGGKLTDVAWRWYTLTSSNPGVATVSADGLVTGVSGGTANITATMHGIVVAGNAPITVTAPLGVPTTIATTPTVPAANVISLFSSAYTNQGVDTWQTGWSTCCNTLLDPYLINTHPVKQYSLFNFVGVEFGLATPANTVNATTMTHFHVDVWSPNPSSNLEIQLVNDPAGTAAIGRYQAGAFASGNWVSLDIPLSSFTGLTAKDKIQQLLFVAAGPTVLYIDNVYFHN